MSPAEVPEPRLAEEDGQETGTHPGPAPVRRASPSVDPEIERLQLKLDELRTRIQESLPDGYNLNELIKASKEGHESEDVFEITGELEALERLAGPLTVPGMTPPPAFDDDVYLEPLIEEDEVRTSSKSGQQWKWVLLAVLVVAVIAVVVSVVVLAG